MLRKLFLAAAVALVTALTPAAASAWGVAHVGYTRVSPYGSYHYDRTAHSTPYGYHAGGYGYSAGGYHYGYGAAYGGYHAPYAAGYAGGYRYAAPTGAYRTGVYQAW
jgi:hypothetical protein